MVETWCSNMSKNTVWNLRVPIPLNKRLERYIDADSFTTKSEFIRVAVRDRLEEEFEKLRKEEEEQQPRESIDRTTPRSEKEPAALSEEEEAQLQEAASQTTSEGENPIETVLGGR